jgi:hypothetical protein
MEWFAIAWPILTVTILYKYFSKYTVWWELLVPITCALLTIMASKMIIEKVNVSDKEYIDSKIVATEHHEPWIEKIPCSHYIRDSKGNIVGRMHAYDTWHHPRKYVVCCKHGSSLVNQQYYNYLKDLWNNEKSHTPIRFSALVNGDIHTSIWDEKFEHIESASFTDNYENKVQSSKSIFNFHPMTPEDKEKYNLYQYPRMNKVRIDSVIGYVGDDLVEGRDLLDKYNAVLGDMRRLHVWFLFYYNQPMAAGETQETLWKGGNRNEVVITIGLDSNNQVKWVYPFSWAKEETPKVAIRDFIASQKKFDFKSSIEYAVSQVKENITVRDFSEFDYLETAIAGWQIFLIHILTIGVCIGVGVWVVKNDINEPVNSGKRNLRGVRI